MCTQTIDHIKGQIHMDKKKLQPNESLNLTTLWQIYNLRYIDRHSIVPPWKSADNDDQNILHSNSVFLLSWLPRPYFQKAKNE